MLRDGAHALAVDPGDAQVVLHWLGQHPQVRLEAILITHHHSDHTGGAAALQQATGAVIYAPAAEPLAAPHTPVTGGQCVQWRQLALQVLQVPGHTAGHVAYWAHPAPDLPVLFCGDTLFAAGCGRIFEGTAAQMLASLDLLASLPADTRVCCAHEYTLANLRFAQAAQPGLGAVQARMVHGQALRQQGLPTLPSTLAIELATNPFLRSRSPEVRATLAAHTGLLPTDDVQAFAQLREWKNHFQ